MGTPAGWFPDQHDPTKMRFWDGERWTDARVNAGQTPPDPARIDETAPPAVVTPADQDEVKQRPGCLAWIGIVAGLVVFPVIAYSMATSTDDEPDLHWGAFDVCTEFVKDQLRAPSTAQFRNYHQDDGEVVVNQYGDTFVVRSSVDSENGFGAMIRNDFTCTVDHIADGRFRLDDITFLDS